MKRLLALPFLLLCVGSPTALMAQDAAPATAAPATADKPPLTTEQLDQLVAPIALYPDDLLTQIFMASTYPLEIVQADRWVKANTSLKGDALDAALEKQPWDASVKSLVGFPDTLAMMSDKLDITTQLGDAFISQQKDVMAAVQRLRAKAKDAGNLQSNQQQTVTVQAAPAGATTTQTIIIQPAQPQVVYVPQYNPTVVYGAWPYPAYPPAPYYPPGYVAGTAILSFGVGVAVGAIWNNNSYGHCNWNNGSVNINRNTNINVNNNNFNNANINRNNNNFNGGGGQQWQHNPQHRQGVPYNNKAAANQFGGVSKADASQARQEFRGRESGGQSPFGGQGGNRGNAGASTRDMNNRGGQGAGQGTGQGGMQNRGGGGQAQNRQGQSGAFNDVNRGGGAARDASNRGANSRGTGAQQTPARQAGGGGQAQNRQAQAPRAAPTRSAPASRPSGGGASRGGGGGGRGGGGRR